MMVTDSFSGPRELREQVLGFVGRQPVDQRLDDGHHGPLCLVAVLDVGAG
jgi:hypothetical protein